MSLIQLKFIGSKHAFYTWRCKKFADQLSYNTTYQGSPRTMGLLGYIEWVNNMFYLIFYILLWNRTHNSQWVGLQMLYDELSPKCSVAPIVSTPWETPATVVSFLLPRASMMSISPEDGQGPYSLCRGFIQIAVQTRNTVSFTSKNGKIH